MLRKKFYMYFSIFFIFMNFLVFGEELSPDIQKIIERGRLIVGMTENDQAPFYYVDKNGLLSGLDVELAKGIAKDLGVKVEFNRKASSFNDVVDLLVNGEIDIAISKLSRTMARSKKVKYSNPYIVFHQGLLLNRLNLARQVPSEDKKEIINFFRYLKGKIGVIKDSSYVSYAKQNFPLAEIIEYPTWEDVVNASMNGEIICAYRDEMEIKKIIRGRPEAALKLKTAIIKDMRDSIAIAVAWDSTQLLFFVNTYLENLNLDLNAEKLLDKYSDIFEN